jgi:hypothetical protein
MGPRSDTTEQQSVLRRSSWPANAAKFCNLEVDHGVFPQARSGVSGEKSEAERFLALVAEAEAKDPEIKSLQASLIVAAKLGIADDSRTLARISTPSCLGFARKAKLLSPCACHSATSSCLPVRLGSVPSTWRQWLFLM